MKTKSSIKNSITAMMANIINIIIGLIAQALFIKLLGKEFLGINGLFNNIISMLSIVELGIGNAIIFNLYKPLVNDDKKTINSLMKFYKKAYNIIAIIVLLIGLGITPFLGYFVNNTDLNINITIVYLLFIIDIVCSYLVSYKRSMLYADQKNYIINLVHMAYFIILNIAQLVILFITHNYYLYLIVKIIMRLIENLVINIIVNIKYKYLNTKEGKDLDKNILSDIIKKIKSLFFHKIGTFIVLGTDNLIISRFLGIGTVGLYSNYYLIIDSVNKLFGQAIGSVTPSIGHLLVNNTKEKCFNVFKNIRFINFWIATFSGTSILVLMHPFIKIWIGENYLLSFSILCVLVFNYYQKMMRYSYSTFKEAAGIYYEDRYVPLLESATNIIVSIVLVKTIGLLGVFIGTVISGFWLWFYSYPKFIYKGLFNKSIKNYLLETIAYILIFIIIATSTYLISTIFSSINNTWIILIINLFICLIIPNLIIIVLFRKKDTYKYLINIIKKNINKIIKHTK